ncbi:MAG: UDP-N-acetylmuramate dehydrogenase [Deltaproteobacteria bacterium]|nr:UDP-N-acetylmuramate dehydrogenase [Candidatus Zymogenaceae bacterium]
MQSLERTIRGTVLFDEPMARHTSYRVGGPADVFIVPADIDDLAAAVGILHERGVAVFILGRGTNLLVRDGGIRGCVVSMEEITKIERTDPEVVSAGAGAAIMEVVNRCMEWSLTGLEKLAGIPGSMGGAVVMNAGAHGAYMDSVVNAATMLGPDGTVYEKTRDQLGLGYRSSKLGGAEIILDVRLSLGSGDREEISQVVTEKLAWRRDRQPLSLPSAGSVFKNPPGMPAGRVIAELGFKGTRVGGAEVSELHANFIVNRGGARAVDILSLIDRIVLKARDERGIELEPEIKIIGED